VVPVLVALGSFVTTLAGGFAALRFRDYQHLILGLAAGLMLGVVAFDLVPEALTLQPGELFGVRLALLAAVAGFLTLHIVERSWRSTARTRSSTRATCTPRVSASSPGPPWSATA
jgi:zinc and cadmium transporter